MAVDQVNAVLNGRLSIETVDGNLYSRLEVRGAALTLGVDTIAYLPRMRVRYDLWSLLDSRLQVDSLIIDSLHISLSQRDDGSWNLMSLLPEALEETADDSSSESDLSVDLGNIILFECSADLETLDTFLPQELDRFTLRGSAFYSHERQRLRVDSLALQARRPHFRLQRLITDLTMDRTVLTIDTLSIQTSENLIEASGHYSYVGPAIGNLRLRTDPLKLREFATWLGETIPSAQPTLVLDAAVRDDTLTANLIVNDTLQEIRISGRLKPFSSLIDSNVSTVMEYAVRIGLDSILFDHWIPGAELNTETSGDILIHGTGADLNTASVAVEAEFSRFRMMDYDLGHVTVGAEYSGGDVQTATTMTGDYGISEAAAEVADLMDIPAYNATLAVRDFDIAALKLADTLTSNVNLSLTAKGKGFDPKSLDGNCRALVQASRIGDLSLDTLFTIFDYSGSALNIDTLFLITEPGTILAGGNYSFNNRTDLIFEASLGRLNAVAGLLQVDTLAAEGVISGHIAGIPDSLKADLDAKLHGIVVDSNRTDSLTLAGTFLYQDSLLTGNARGRIVNLFTSGYVIPQIDIVGEIDTGRYVIETEFVFNEDISGSLAAEYVSDSIPVVMLPEPALNIGEQTWVCGDEPVTLELHPDRYVIDGFRLSRSDTTAVQFVEINGTFSPERDQDLTLSLRDIDLSAFARDLELPMEMAGRASFDAHLTGTLDNPEITGSSYLTDGGIYEYDFESLGGRFSVRDSLLQLDYTLTVQEPESLTVEGQLPLHSFFDGTQSPGATHALMDIDITSHHFTLDILRLAGYSVKEADGNLDIQLHAYNSLDDPRLEGTVKIDGGTVEVPDRGIHFSDMAARLTFDSSRATMERLVAKRDKDSLVASGYVDFDDGIMSGRFSGFEFLARADNLWLVRHKDYEIRADIDIKLGGDTGQTTYGGTIRVVRSSFSLPALLEESASTGDDYSVPMLVAATRDTITLDSPSEAEEPVDSTAGFLPDEIVDALRGSLKLTFLRNNWIRSPNMNFEIGGELEIIKADSVFELFGFINIIRGNYDLYGKRFVIKEGQLTFDGGSEMNPVAAITAEHVFRTPDRDKKRLTLIISDRVREPSLTFNLDGAEISEGDAVSYLMFGRPLNELTSAQRTTLAGGSSGGKGSLAKGLAANLLAGQLTKALQNKFNLDVVEIKAQDDWQSASFIAGKYLTTDLFASYQRGLGSGHDDDDIIPEIITLEYEIIRNVSLQMVAGDDRSSGFDLILKLMHR
jgi:translocation and assembly module TamB